MKYIQLEHNTQDGYPSTEHVENTVAQALLMYEVLLTDWNQEKQKLHLICRGSSGLMRATLIASFAIKVAKEERDVIISFDHAGAATICHPTMPAYRASIIGPVYHCIIDDFISSGQTMFAIKEYILSRYDKITINSVIVSRGYGLSTDFEDNRFTVKKLFSLS